MEWRTFQTLDLVGLASYVMEIWHEPPPWTAWPVKASGCEEPRAMEVEAPVKPLFWQGKLDPEGSSGVLIEPSNGLGTARTMWALEAAAKPQMAA
jgi:hypothetical protein